MNRYFSRHSGTKYRYKAIKGYYTPKLLSHIYLW